MSDEPRIIVRNNNRTIVQQINQTKQIVAEVKQGIPGAAGGTVTTVINITIPSVAWNLAHYLNRYPSVTIFDSAGDLVLADYRHIDSNVITATFTAPTSGVAYLN